MFFPRLASAFRDAWRQLRREPAPALLIALTMAIGIAAAAAIFTVARGVVFRPLPYQDPPALVVLEEFQTGESRDQTSVAFGNLPRFKAATSFVSLTAFAYSEFVISGEADAERVIGATADGDLLKTLGSMPMIGRGITADDGGENPAHVVVLAYGLWRRRFAGDRGLIGRSIVIDAVPYSVIGVMTSSFEFPRTAAMDREVEVWTPRRPPPPMMARRGIRDLTVIARLSPGVSLTQAQQEMTAVSRLAERDNAQLDKGWTSRVVGLRDVVVGRVRPVIILLSACVGVLLLIACVNASAASLARVTVRRQAFGVRLALGATNRQLVELVLAEMALLAVAAAVMALPLSVVVRGVLVHLAPVAIPRQQWIVVDDVTLLFTAVVAGVTALVAAAGPISWLRRMNVSEFIGDATRTMAGSRARTRSLAVFVIGQLAMGTVLIAITVSLYGKFIAMNRVDPGFVADRVMTATIPLRGMRYQDPKVRSALTSQLLDRVRAIPGVERAAVATLMPMSGGLMSAPYRVITVSPDSNATAALRAVSPDFFKTLGIAVKRGRAIDNGDAEATEPVAVVNEAFVRQSMGARSPIGIAVNLTPPGSDTAQSFRIVGVVSNAKEKDLLGPDSPIIYFSDRQASFPHTVLAVKSHGTPPVTAIRAALRDLDPSLALDDVNPLASKVRATYALSFFLLNILAAFAISAAILVAVGVYGSVSYVVSADLKAIGVRLALGATQRSILATLLGRAATWAFLGCVVGLALSAVITRVVGYAGLGVTGVTALASATAILLLAIGATWVPAWRASGTDAVTALRLQ
jgi:predicted permease